MGTASGCPGPWLLHWPLVHEEVSFILLPAMHWSLLMVNLTSGVPSILSALPSFRQSGLLPPMDTLLRLFSWKDFLGFRELEIPGNLGPLAKPLANG